MTLDAYAPCPTGSGKKIKWSDLKGLDEFDRILAMIRNRQAENVFRAIDRLYAKQESDISRAFCDTLRVQALCSTGKMDEGFDLVEKTIEKYPNFGLPRETRGDILYAQEDFAEAGDGFLDALTHYPPEATWHRARTLVKLGSCHNFQGRPLAAWAAWQRALKVDSQYEAAREAIEQYIWSNELLPNAARHGLELRSPDELVVFNEETRRRWDEVLANSGDWGLDDLANAFETLANDDPYDLAAWYDLGLVRAWQGENAASIDAFEHYVRHEEDLDAAADAWDICEVLRLGVGAEEYSDHIHYVAMYEVQDPKAFIEALRQARNILVLGGANEDIQTLHWMDREPPEPQSGVPLIGAPPKQLGQINLMPGGVEVVATTQENLARTRSGFDQLIGESARNVGEYHRPASVETLDAEPFLTYFSGEDDREEKMVEATQHYFEHEWVQRPLRSLGGLTPLDAAGSDDYRKMLEGVLRFRERNFARYGLPYDFERLRNKLGLASPKGDEPEGKLAISAMSAAQLAELDADSLEDEDLIAAYRTAVGLDAPTLSERFARTLTTRESVREKLPIESVYLRLAQLVLDRDATDEALIVLDEAEQYLSGSAPVTDERAARKLRTMRARIKLRSEPEAAVEQYRSLCDATPNDLDLVAEVAESLLSAGRFADAQAFAQRGLDVAEEARDRDRQAQFQEYLAEASARA